MHGIVAKCEGLGWRNKQWATKEGKTYGGHPMRKCHVYTILANPLYAALASLGRKSEECSSFDLGRVRVDRRLSVTLLARTIVFIDKLAQSRGGVAQPKEGVP